jgi:hypothetical protein
MPLGVRKTLCCGTTAELHMTRLHLRWAAAMAPLLALFVSIPAGAQDYFGRNKVQYETFNWRILKSEHFDNFFYPPESLVVSDAGRMAERWYARHSDTFRHAFDRKSLISRTSSRPTSSESSSRRARVASPSRTGLA